MKGRSLFRLALLLCACTFALAQAAPAQTSTKPAAKAVTTIPTPIHGIPWLTTSTSAPRAI
jgi:hypothetical protein